MLLMWQRDEIKRCDVSRLGVGVAIVVQLSNFKNLMKLWFLEMIDSTYSDVEALPFIETSVWL